MQDRIKNILATLAFLTLFPILSLATEDDAADAFGGRVSVEFDYKIAKGLHIFASEEIRLRGSDILDRFHTSAGLSYKVNKYFKVGVSYTAIALYETDITQLGGGMAQVSKYYEWRHRVSADLIGMYKTGIWKFSLRERFQGTFRRDELNNYQRPQNTWVLRSRIKVACAFRQVPLEPYVSFEPRLLLNGAAWGQESMTQQFENAEFLGHKDVYFNRLRSVIGLEWKMAARHSLEIYGMYDYLREKDIDAFKEDSKKGIGLKRATIWQTAHKGTVGIGYKFSF